MNNTDFGIGFDATETPLLSAALLRAESVAPQLVKASLGHKSPSKKLCVGVRENEMAFGDSKSCRFLASTGTASCRAFWFRNPKTTASFVVHLNADSEEITIMAGLDKIARDGEPLDMYIIAGENKCDNARWPKASPNESAYEVEATLGKVMKRGNITPKVINLFGNKVTPNGVLDTVTGQLFYVDSKVVEPYTNALNGDDRTCGVPVEIIYDGLAKGRFHE